ncbi:MOSC domain-containing protein [Haladaptatus sp. T7]|uniref:MOSC domain-containing protein n=1 Tax=Haladaptatus sp. T7 TaxID=2029368 RepID=UPI0021A25420|nr:MOSC domain-containing protein [Haladaptatus sp. T7]GKZ14449.1 molybdenum cofactor biosynthesis protein [Haladaptatus sp. T7]
MGMAQITDLFITGTGSEPMQSVTEVHAVADRGLRGDRYFNGTGYYSPYDVCQVTLIANEAIDAIDREFGLDLTAGEHRRNVVTEGIDVHDLLKHRFRVGDALLEGTRPRPPCAHVEQLNEQEGVARALKDGRGGICADVVESGRIGVGDSISDIEAMDKTASIIERLRSK